MLSIFVAVASYNSRDNPYLTQVLTNYGGMGATQRYNVTVEVHTVETWSVEQLAALHAAVAPSAHFRYDFVVYEPSIRLQLTCQHRRRMQAVVHDHDLFVYQEDDLDIRLHHVDTFEQLTRHIETTGLLPGEKILEADRERNTFFPIVGFFRFEYLNSIDSDGTAAAEIAIDGTAAAPTLRRYLIELPMQIPLAPRCVAGLPFIADEVNPHQGFFMLTRSQILRLDETCGFFSQGEIVLKEDRAQRYGDAYPMVSATSQPPTRVARSPPTCPLPPTRSHARLAGCTWPRSACSGTTAVSTLQWGCNQGSGATPKRWYRTRCTTFRQSPSTTFARRTLLASRRRALRPWTTFSTRL